MERRAQVTDRIQGRGDVLGRGRSWLTRQERGTRDSRQLLELRARFATVDAAFSVPPCTDTPCSCGPAFRAAMEAALTAKYAKEDQADEAVG